jgi:hypothetical protein
MEFSITCTKDFHKIALLKSQPEGINLMDLWLSCRSRQIPEQKPKQGLKTNFTTFSTQNYY